MDRIIELGIGAVRIPLLWRQLDSAPSNRTDTRPQLLSWRQRREQICAFVAALPTDIDVVAGFGLPPIDVAIAYSEDRSTLGGSIDAFLASFVPELGRDIDWELWNEPNASDFYLSRIVDGGHRPWTGEEYVEDAMLPALRAIERLSPNSKMCAATFAENGLVGHDDRLPALSNTLPDNKRFRSLRASNPDHRYFLIPDFAKDVFEAVDAIGQRESLRTLNFGCHPYPYFQIWKTGDADLSTKSAGLVDAFGSAMNSSSVARDGELWITEAGARSFDVLDNNRPFTKQQAQFVTDLTSMNNVKPVSRLFVYKLRDLPFDLRQEKTFGLLDHRGRAKPAFEVVKRAAALDPRPRKRVAMRFGDVERQSDRLRSSTTFSYTTGDLEDFEMVYPGRNDGDWIELQSALRLDPSGPLGMDMALRAYEEWRGVRVSLFDQSDPDSPEELLAIDIDPVAPPILHHGGSSAPAHEFPHRSGRFDARRIEHVSTLWGKDHVQAVVRYQNMTAFAKIPATTTHTDTFAPTVRITAGRGPRAPLLIGSIQLHRDAPERSIDPTEA